jgi:GNAT superfamily N-acetyltransferase
MQIRRGTPEDAETLVGFQLLMAFETEALRLDRATVSAGVGAVFEDPARGTYWVAEVDGQVVGSLLATPEWSDWRNATVWWIQSLYVREEFRRQGVFRRLFQHLRDLVEANGSLTGLRLYVEKGNLTAKRAYEAMGMDGRHYDMFEWME